MFNVKSVKKVVMWILIVVGVFSFGILSGCVAGYSSTAAFGLGSSGDQAAADILNKSSSSEKGKATTKKEKASDTTSKKDFNEARNVSSRDGY